MDKQRLVKLHTEGKTDTEIASIMHVSRQLVQVNRKKLGLTSNFSYKSFRKEEELLILIEFFSSRFNLTFHINSNHAIYLLKKDFEHFKQLVLPHMRQELLYKLSLNHVNLGKSGDR